MYSDQKTVVAAGGAVPRHVAIRWRWSDLDLANLITCWRGFGQAIAMSLAFGLVMPLSAADRVAQSATSAATDGAPSSASSGVAESSASALRAHHLPPGIRAQLDGRLDEAFWADAPVHNRFSQHQPQPGPWNDPAYRTEVRIVVEDDALVVGIRAHDPRPAEIRSPLLRRDQVQRDQDYVAILLDTAGDRRSAQFIRVNPRGVIGDGLFIADRTAQVEGNDGDEDFSPDFEVDAAASIDATGYTVELRIPFSALRLPRRSADEPFRDWRVMVVRSIPRAASTVITSVPVPREALSFIATMQPLEGVGAVAARLQAASFWAVRPAITVRASRAQGSEPQALDREASLGIDLKWRPRADWVVDATLNPDFSQVEVDTPQLAGNTRFAISVLEKRPFFLESTDVLDLPVHAFYSRSVTDPRAGVRATWRGAQADATGLAMRDDGGGVLLLPAPFGTRVVAQDVVSEVVMLRSRWHFLLGSRPPAQESEAAAAGAPPSTHGRLSLGGLLTRRDYRGGGGNEVAGVDALWRPNEATRLRLRALTSSTRASQLDSAEPRLTSGKDRGDLWFVAASQRQATWALNAEWQRTGAGFRNDNGFVEQAGVQRTMAEWINRHGALPMGPFDAHEFETFVWVEQRHALDDPISGVTGQTVTRRVHPGVWWTADQNIEAWTHLIADAERVRPGGRLHPVRGVAGQFGINPAPWFTRLTVEAQVGERVDVDADRVGRGAVWTIDARWRADLPSGLLPRPRASTAATARWGLEVRQRWQQGTIDQPSGSRALTDTAWQTLAVLHVSERDSVRAIVQLSRTRRAADAAAALTAADQLTRVTSLVAQRRVGVGRVLAAGWIREQRAATSEVAPATSSTRDEVFVKWSFGW